MEAQLTQAPPPTTAETRLKMSYEEYLAWAGEDTRAEWVAGEVIVHMPPKERHQDLATFLAALLRFLADIMQLGKVLSAPFEVKLWADGPSRDPDVLFIRSDHLSRLTENRLEGAPDLVIEIVSDDSVGRDRADKFYEYQTAGVPEYWVFDPRAGKERIDGWALDEGGSYAPIVADGDGGYHSAVIPGLLFRVEWLKRESLPNPLAVLTEMVGADRVMAALRGPGM